VFGLSEKGAEGSVAAEFTFLGTVVEYSLGSDSRSFGYEYNTAL